MNPTPPPGYRLLTDEEKKLPLPMDAIALLEGKWMVLSKLPLEQDPSTLTFATRQPAPEGATAETDAEVVDGKLVAVQGPRVAAVPASFARKLERERDAVRAELAEERKRREDADTRNVIISRNIVTADKKRRFAESELAAERKLREDAEKALQKATQCDCGDAYVADSDCPRCAPTVARCARAQVEKLTAELAAVKAKLEDVTIREVFLHQSLDSALSEAHRLRDALREMVRWHGICASFLNGDEAARMKLALDNSIAALAAQPSAQEAK